MLYDDLKKNLSATLYERVTSPLIGSFAISWSIWNYKFFLVLLSSETYSQKIVILNSMFPWFNSLKGFLLSLSNTFIMPLLGVVFYLFVYPRIAKYVYKIWQEYIADKEKIQQQIKSQIPITEEKANKLRQSIANKSMEFEKLLEDKTIRIRELENRNDININRLEEKDKIITELKILLERNDKELNSYKNRELVMERKKLTPNERGTLYGRGEHYCSKCFYSEPLKLIRLPIDGDPGKYLECPVCSAQYTHDYFSVPARSTHSVDNDFLCWTAGTHKICPSCGKDGNKEDAFLARLSKDKYVCILCEKEYNKVSSVTPQEVRKSQ